ncbi:hypothetical protein H2201_000908 [Coniosporium apollinis]|uniref:Uncharacterized protein n=1 Tax=Coniosporium apollinis TaxID=61459 RepID=A0ABQ9P9M7_9PEZI|nr:hypothetical protein H2201_000908 [Coniosporium apollinis]
MFTAAIVDILSLMWQSLALLCAGVLAVAALVVFVLQLPQAICFCFGILYCLLATYHVARTTLRHLRPRGKLLQLIDLPLVAGMRIARGVKVLPGLMYHSTGRFLTHLRLRGAPPAKFRFQDLPAELRDMVYRHVIDDIVGPLDNSVIGRPELAKLMLSGITTVSPQIRTEILTQVFRDKRNLSFMFNNVRDNRALRGFLTTMHQYTRRTVPRLQIILSHKVGYLPQWVFNSALNALFRSRVSCNVTFGWSESSLSPYTNEIIVYGVLKLLERMSRNGVEIRVRALESTVWRGRGDHFWDQKETIEFTAMFRHRGDRRQLGKEKEADVLIFI